MDKWVMKKQIYLTNMNLFLEKSIREESGEADKWLRDQEDAFIAELIRNN